MQPKRKPKLVRKFPPIAVSFKEALTLVPIGKSKLHEALANGTIKSSLVMGVRAIDYNSLMEVFAPTAQFTRAHNRSPGRPKTKNSNQQQLAS